MTTTFTHGYALLIGINEHQVADWALPAVSKDIDALHAVLISSERCAYPPAHVRVLRGAAATRTAILDGLDWLQTQLATDASGNATAVVYYTGHGWRNESAQPPAYYLIPYDTQRQGDTPKPATALRAEDFAAAIAGLTPQRLFVVLDCCHAAGIDAKNMGAYVPAALSVDLLLTDNAAKGPTLTGKDAKGLEQLAVGHGRAVLSSSQGIERSYIRTDHTMSIFTYHLIEALTGHAQPQGGATEVLASDILSHVHRRVPASAQQQGKEQHPDYKLTGNFPVALLLGGKGLGASATAPDPLQPVTLPPAPLATDQATNTGSGAIAQGPGGIAAGERGIAVGGNVTSSTFNTGDNSTIQQAHGRNIAQAGPGGLATINDRSRHTAFDQRGQTIHGAQTNIEGGVYTSITHTGTNLPPVNIAAELRKLLAQITQAGEQGILDDITAIDAESGLKKAIALTNKPTPNRQTILEHLAAVQTTLTPAIQNVAASGGLLTAITTVIALVRQHIP